MAVAAASVADSDDGTSPRGYVHHSVTQGSFRHGRCSVFGAHPRSLCADAEIGHY